MACAQNGVQNRLRRGDFEEFFALAERYQSVFFAVNDEDGTLDFFDKLVGAYLITEQPLYGQPK